MCCLSHFTSILMDSLPSCMGFTQLPLLQYILMRTIAALLLHPLNSVTISSPSHLTQEGNLSYACLFQQPARSIFMSQVQCYKKNKGKVSGPNFSRITMSHQSYNINHKNITLLLQVQLQEVKLSIKIIFCHLFFRYFLS